MKLETKRQFFLGIKRGIPIAIGYFPVSFTFGLMATKGGIPAWLTVLISISNLTSAGQFAGVNLMIASASYYEIALTTFLINLRYMLMSMSLSQKLKRPMSIIKRMILGYGITDEIFAVAMSENGLKDNKVTASYMYGLILGPFLGWTLGTLFGAYTSGILPQRLSEAMGIALYGMFIAIIIPPARNSMKIFMVILIAVLCTILMYYVPVFKSISEGFRIIIATIIAAGIGAALFPVEEREEVCEE